MIHQPYGAHPTAVFGRYDYDAAHLKLYVEHSKRAERIGDYIRDYILATKRPQRISREDRRHGADAKAQSRSGTGLLTMEIRATEIMARRGCPRAQRSRNRRRRASRLPQVACFLAKSTHAPDLTPLLEIGVANMRPKDTPVGLADSRIFYRATCWSGFLDVMGMNLHRGVVDTGFLGALEVDRFGNINTTLSKEEGRVRYFNGSAGGSDVASLAKRVIVIMRHEKRKLSGRGCSSHQPGFRRRQDTRGAVSARRRSPPHHHRQMRVRLRSK